MTPSNANLTLIQGGGEDEEFDKDLVVTSDLDEWQCEVEITFVRQLELKEIWPDGDHPENPSAEDVRAVMEKAGRAMKVLKDWELLDEPEVEVYVDNGEDAEISYPWQDRPSLGKL